MRGGCGMEENKNLHPDVLQFKQFMREHPQLITELRKNNQTLQSLFEEWTVLGSDHERWEPYRQQTKKTDASEQRSASDTLSHVVSLFKQMDVQELQGLLGQFSSVLSNVQNVIQSFQRPNSQQTQREQDSPFSFRHD